MRLIESLRRRRSEKKQTAESAYWELVGTIANGDDEPTAKDTSKAEKLLHETGRTVDHLEHHVALVRERTTLEDVAASLEKATAANKSAAVAVGKHDEERKRILAAWEKKHADLRAESSRTKLAVNAARKAIGRIAAIERELAGANAEPVRELTASERQASQIAEADLRSAITGLEECERERKRLAEHRPENPETAEKLESQLAKREEEFRSRRKRALASLDALGVVEAEEVSP